MKTMCKTDELVAQFLESIEPNEVIGTLGSMLENFIQHAPLERVDLANAASIINRLNAFIFDLQLAQRPNGLSTLSEEPTKCMHN